MPRRCQDSQAIRCGHQHWTTQSEKTTPMQQAAVVAELPPPGPPTMASPTSLMSYNISLNLSSIFAMLPSSRLFTKLRRGVFLGQIEAYELPSSSAVDGWSTETPAFNSLPEAPSLLDVDPVASFPGPWGFFTSWYMVGLFVMVCRAPCNFFPRIRVLNLFLGSLTPSDAERDNPFANTQSNSLSPCIPLWTHFCQLLSTHQVDTTTFFGHAAVRLLADHHPTDAASTVSLFRIQDAIDVVPACFADL